MHTHSYSWALLYRIISVRLNICVGRQWRDTCGIIPVSWESQGAAPSGRHAGLEKMFLGEVNVIGLDL